jgi:predicted NAD-dependent protein-ADP-ribosyltransferase YbiA (DUF1768 family)
MKLEKKLILLLLLLLLKIANFNATHTRIHGNDYNGSELYYMMKKSVKKKD